MAHSKKDAVAVRQSATLASNHRFEPDSFADAWKLCGALVGTGFLPNAIRTPAQAMAVYMVGRELGLPIMSSFGGISVVDGKPCLSADLMRGLAMQSGLVEFFHCTESTDQIATWETKRKDSEHIHRRSFTIKEAEKANLLGKNNWKKYPADMLRHRASSRLAREVYPEVISGVYTPDEMDADAATPEPTNGGGNHGWAPVEQAQQPAEIVIESAPVVQPQPEPEKPAEPKPEPARLEVVPEPVDEIATNPEPDETALMPEQPADEMPGLRQLLDIFKKKYSRDVLVQTMDLLGLPADGRKWTNDHKEFAREWLHNCGCELSPDPEIPPQIDLASLDQWVDEWRAELHKWINWDTNGNV